MTGPDGNIRRQRGIVMSSEKFRRDGRDKRHSGSGKRHRDRDGQRTDVPQTAPADTVIDDTEGARTAPQKATAERAEPASWGFMSSRRWRRELVIGVPLLLVAVGGAVAAVWWSSKERPGASAGGAARRAAAESSGTAIDAEPADDGSHPHGLARAPQVASTETGGLLSEPVTAAPDPFGTSDAPDRSAGDVPLASSDGPRGFPDTPPSDAANFELPTDTTRGGAAVAIDAPRTLPLEPPRSPIPLDAPANPMGRDSRGLESRSAADPIMSQPGEAVTARAPEQSPTTPWDGADRGITANTAASGPPIDAAVQTDLPEVREPQRSAGRPAARPEPPGAAVVTEPLSREALQVGAEPSSEGGRHSGTGEGDGGGGFPRGGPPFHVSPAPADSHTRVAADDSGLVFDTAGARSLAPNPGEAVAREVRSLPNDFEAPGEVSQPDAFAASGMETTTEARLGPAEPPVAAAAVAADDATDGSPEAGRFDVGRPPLPASGAAEPDVPISAADLHEASEAPARLPA
ncbi:MAG: hypothetical protein D6725_16605, partial [Planctomycetota bacterium]